VSYALSGQYTWDGLGRFLVGTLCAAAIFAAFMILVQSLAFWIGNTTYLSSLALNAMLTFAIYPITLFDNTAKLILFTLIPAALMGALPAEFVHTFTWGTLAEIFLGSVIFLFLAVAGFRLGLRRYESGSGIQVEV
jgi:ABC-2 type transport system permease protein